MSCKGEPFITIGSGKRWYFNGQQRNDITMHEVARALSQLPRFNGHTKLVQGYVYTVGQHSIKVSYITGTLDGLMHDSHESIIGDVATPLKRHLEESGLAYTHLDRVTFERFAELFSISNPLPPEVKRADAIMCMIEAHYLLPNKGADIWLGPQHEEIVEEANHLRRTRPELRPAAWSPGNTHRTFINRYWSLK